jgi:hypothetical protein
MKRSRIVSLVVLAGLTSGCGHAPSFNLLGSYFPAWLVCLPVAISLTVALRILVRRLGIEEYFRPEFLSYLATSAFLTFLLWLLFFN